MKKKVLSLCMCLSIVLTACGSNKELDKYYEEMSAFSTNLSTIKENIDTIDVNDPASGTELLSYLDAMDEQFLILSEMEVPKEFVNNETLSDEAYTYMHEAVTLYHQYYDNPDCDISTFDAAYENYTRAMKRVSYISVLLQGELPEDADVEVYEEQSTDFDPITDEWSDTEE